MTDERSERLRKRRKQSLEARTEASSNGESSEPAKSAESTEENDGQDDREETVSIKEEQIGTYMYLPESQTANLRRLYNVLKAEYEFEYGEEFEKNRHFYPLVVRYGLERLDGMDAAEIRRCLEELP